VPAAAWDKVSEVTPKRALWALAGLLTIITTLACAYIYTLRQDLKRLKATLDESLSLKFGALWDKLCNPHCPSCKTPLSQKIKRGAVYSLGTPNTTHVNPDKVILECIHCDKEITLIDDAGRVLPLKDAKEQVAGLRST
jgi:hypothetical protein